MRPSSFAHSLRPLDERPSIIDAAAEALVNTLSSPSSVPLCLEGFNSHFFCKHVAQHRLPLFSQHPASIQAHIYICVGGLGTRAAFDWKYFFLLGRGEIIPCAAGISPGQRHKISSEVVPIFAAPSQFHQSSIQLPWTGGCYGRTCSMVSSF